jgi:pimeloyl-ACP methyl ester carboxylesterase
MTVRSPSARRAAASDRSIVRRIHVSRAVQRGLLRALAGPALASLVVACGTAETSSAPTSSTGRPPATDATGPAKIEGRFDVGGHRLYLECRGSVPPTVVYMHGSIRDRSIVPHVNGGAIMGNLADEHRVCVYDRRNVGSSDTVDSPQLPSDALDDMRRLLAAAHVTPPYVLLGASFGGLLAYLYANIHPDEVVGMVLLDSGFPDELRLERLFKPHDRLKGSSADDERNSLERISEYKVYRAAQRYIGKEPAIPVTYLSSIPEGFDVNDFGIPEYNRRILGLQKAFVERFSPGRYVRVQAPHFMEVVLADRIDDELRRVIAAAGAAAH